MSDDSYKVWADADHAWAAYKRYRNTNHYPLLMFDPSAYTYTILYKDGHAKVDWDGTLMEVTKDEATREWGQWVEE